MSTHRKIEWSLLLLGCLGLVCSVWFGEHRIEQILLAIITLSAGLHVVHWYDGQKANQIVMVGALLLVVYDVYMIFVGTTPMYVGLGFGIVLLALALRLRRDFRS